MPGYEQFSKFNPSIKAELSPKIKLASPKVMSTYSPICQKCSFTQTINNFSSFAVAAAASPTKRHESANKIENPEITEAINSLNMEKFQRAKKLLRGWSSQLDLLSSASTLTFIPDNEESNIYICVCGKVLINTKATLCDECTLINAQSKMSGELFSFDAKSNNLIAKWAVLEDKELFLYDKQDDSKPTSILSLVDFFISLNGVRSLSHKGVTYYGLQLQSPKTNVSFYSLNPQELEKWINAINSIIKCANINEFYDMKGLLGKGKFGVVREAIHIQSGVHVAIKGLIKSKMKPQDLDMIRREVEILRLSQHPNIIKLYDFFETDQYVFIVIELLKGSDLVNYSSKRNFKLSEPHIANIIIQMIKGVEYLHSIGVIHRDLKGENILMSDLSDNASLKLSDFGLSKIIGPTEKCTESYGTLGYAAPELYLQKPYDKSVDIWGIGVVGYTLLSKGMMPFEGANDKDIIWY